MKCPVCSFPTRRFLKKVFDDRYGASGYFSIYRCPSCGFGRTNPVLKKKDIGKLYSKYYPTKKVSASEVRKKIGFSSGLLAWIKGENNIAHRYVRKNSDVLDVGSASGASLLEIKKLGANAFGIEPDPNSQRLAKALKLQVFKGFITDNPFPGKSFDFITASQVIEHEPEPLGFLVSARRRLKPGGRIILSYPNLDSLYRRLFGRRWINWHVPYHLNHFSKKSVNILAKKANLKVKVVKTVTPNLWTEMQIKAIETKPEYGKPSEVWIGRESIPLFLKVVNKAVSILIPPINRLIDMLGLGDNMLVFLEKK